MPERITDDLEFARRVDELGQRGLTQEAIAREVGESDKWAMRRRLNARGWAIGIENRVRDARTEKRLEEMTEELEAIA